MKRMISIVLLLCLCLTLFVGCGKDAEKTGGDETAQSTLPTVPRPTGKEALEGKKILFIGNSYTFFGNAVIHKGYTVLTQEERSNDQGYFYQVCKANGVDVSVTNFTFGSHHTTDIIGEQCESERDCDGEYHKYFLQDPSFDYVVIQPYSEKKYDGDLVEHLQPIVDFFRTANPDVQFLLVVPHMAYDKSYQWVEGIEAAEDAGFIICNWGKMLDDVVKGKTAVPGATLTYDRNSFVVTKDGHHENLLVGYLTAQMVYCAITRESAQGQDYSFCDDSTINSSFNLENFRTNNYNDASETNFVEAYRSEADMLGFQKLIDQYLGI